jgi:hypothetical protein
MGGRCSLLIWGTKGQRLSALDIEVEIRFPGFRVTPYHTYGLPLQGTQDFIKLFLYPLRKELIYTY